MELKTYFAQDAAGNIISSAIVHVFLQGTTTLATGLTRADGTPLENPFAADGAGRIQFRAPDGYYDIQVSAGPGIIQTVTIQCVDYSEAKQTAQEAIDAAAQVVDMNWEQSETRTETDDRTPRLNLPIPVQTNKLRDDVSRLREAFTTLDEHVSDAETEIEKLKMRTNTAIDIKSGAATPVVFAQLVRTEGEGTNLEIQDFAISPARNSIYSLHHRQSDSFGIITRYALSGGTIKNQVDVMLPDKSVGHQGLTVERLDTADKLWVTYGVNPHIAMRFDYNANGAPENVELFKLFEDDRFSPASSCNPTISPDQRFISGFCLELGTGKIFCRVWDFQQMLLSGQGDHTNTAIYEWEVGDGVYVPSEIPVQGHAISGNEVYFWSGGNGTATSVTSRRLHVFTLDGKLISQNHEANVGREAALSDGSGVSYEPEGASIVLSGGKQLLLLGVRSGSSLNPSVFRIWALGLKNPSVSGDLVISGNYQSSLSSNDSSGRDYLAVRSRAEGGVFGAGVNYYGLNDSFSPYEIAEIAGSAGSTRRRVTKYGQQVFTPSSGVTSMIVNKPDSGRVLELQRDGVAIGAVSINTAAMSLFGQGVNIRFGSSDGYTDTNYWEVVSSTGAFRPAADNAYTAGQASLRIKEVFAATATVNTSDERGKKFCDNELSDDVLDAWETINWRAFRFTDSIAVKGEDAARVHFGLGAQSVIAAFAERGLDATRYSLLCYDEWDDQYEPIFALRTVRRTVMHKQKDLVGGMEVEVPVEVEEVEEYDTGERRLVLAAGSRYGIRYEEALALEAALMRRTTMRLEERLAALESK